MSNSSIFSSHYQTPFGPAEALHLSPMRCSITRARPLGTRAVTSQFDLQSKSQWSKNRNAPSYMRSVLTPTSPPWKKAVPILVAHSHSTSGPSAMFAGLNVQDFSDYSEARLHGQQYTRKQVACHDIYKQKARLSWSQEYGRSAVDVPVGSWPTSPVSPPSRATSPPPRVVELEGSPTVPAARFQRAATALAGHIRKSDEALRSWETSPMRTTVMVIKRKPVGSGASPRTSPAKSAVVLCSPNTCDTPDDISASPNKSKAWRLSADAFKPDELLLSAESRIYTPRGSPDKNITLRKKRSKQAVRFRTDTDSVIPDDPHPHLASILETCTDLIASVWSLVDVVSQTHYASEHMQTNVIHIAKLGILLYLAACAWSILTAIRDGILRTIQPLVTLWELVRWLVSSGW